MKTPQLACLLTTTLGVISSGTALAQTLQPWQTVDLLFASGQNSEGQGITSDSYGNLFSAGKAETASTGLGYLLTRRLAGPQ